mmetsp:Transcript_65040/g.190798  ORF Transcript_65040/g.190798 Transcript_65040/m.190798 type:complete len:268 (-) Transcript_65040:319-1122(-)
MDCVVAGGSLSRRSTSSLAPEPAAAIMSWTARGFAASISSQDLASASIISSRGLSSDCEAAGVPKPSRVPNLGGSVLLAGLVDDDAPLVSSIACASESFSTASEVASARLPPLIIRAFTSSSCAATILLSSAFLASSASRASGVHACCPYCPYCRADSGASEDIAASSTVATSLSSLSEKTSLISSSLVVSTVARPPMTATDGRCSDIRVSCEVTAVWKPSSCSTTGSRPASVTCHLLPTLGSRELLLLPRGVPACPRLCMRYEMYC